jgi:hypothetical protein
MPTIVVKDDYNDSAIIDFGDDDTYGIAERVYLVVNEGGTRAELSLTPKQSKKIRKALKKAERVARSFEI